MNAVILAGGFGSRLMPLTDKIIKPMLPLANTPMIDYTVAHLSNFGIKDFIFTLAHKPEQIIDWATGYTDVTCHFSIEDTPLGTLGGVKAAQRLLDDTFIVMSGDALEDIDLAAMLHKHRSSKASITMAVKEVENTSLYGVVEVDAWGTVTGFVEKPLDGQERSKLINCGVYIIERRVLDDIEFFTKYDFAKDLFPKMLAENEKISAYIHDGYWCDIGDIKSYYRANFDIKDKVFFKTSANTKRIEYSSYHIGTNNRSVISATTTLVGHISNCIVGRNSRIASGAVLDNCIVLDDTSVKGRYNSSIISNNFVLFMGQDSITDVNNSNYKQNVSFIS